MSSAATDLGLHEDLFWKVATDPRLAEGVVARSEQPFPFFLPVGSDLGRTALIGGEVKLMLGSNNYLGLTGDERVVAAARRALERYGTSCTGSRLMIGTLDLHEELEAELADWVGCDASVVFATGYLANLGAIYALCGEGDVVLGDSRNHASINDGARISRATTVAIRHNDMGQLDRKLARLREDHRAVLVVWDAVFSMEGDVAPVNEIVEISRRHGARTMIDEAHSLGLLGPEGAGLCADRGAAADLVMGTFTKSLASCGGFIAGDRDVVEYLKVTGRPFMFTAAAIPAAVAAALEALRICRSEPWRAARALGMASRLAAGLQRLPLDVSWHGTGIVSVHVDDELKAMRAWRELYHAGVYVNVAAHPAVPVGSALLRMTTTANHTEEDVDHVAEAFTQPRVLSLLARSDQR
jgi:8-amino-7-oxononanoate synthase